jgi:hypothetical protein
MSIQVSFNQAAYERNLETLKKQVEIYSTCLEAIEKITGKKELQTIEQVEAEIERKSGFSNIPLAAELLKLHLEYNYLLSNLNAIKFEVLDLSKDIPTIKEDVLNKLKIGHTTYLRTELVEDYNVLRRAANELNKLSNPSRINFLKSNYLGKYEVNIQLMNNER